MIHNKQGPSWQAAICIKNHMVRTFDPASLNVCYQYSLLIRMSQALQLGRVQSRLPTPMTTARVVTTIDVLARCARRAIIQTSEAMSSPCIVVTTLAVVMLANMRGRRHAGEYKLW